MDPGPKDRLPKVKSASANLDVLFRAHDAYGRTFDGFKGSIEEIEQKFTEADKIVNFGIGHVEDKKLTQGVSQGATNNGIYSVKDIVFNGNSQEYYAVTKYGEIHRFDWAGTKLPAPKSPLKTFSRFIYCKPTGHYICWTPKKSSFFIARDDFTIAIDTVAIAPIGNIIYGGRKTDEQTFDFFIICEATLNRYSYNPTGNVITLQDCLKMSDVEAEKGFIEHTCFDDPQDDRKQWIYCTYNVNCVIVDVSGRVLGARKGLHENRITAIVATGGSEFVVTGDEKGLLKLWGPRWSYINEIQAHKDRVTHIMEHPIGRSSLSFSRDQSLIAWNFDNFKKLEQLVAPEVIERLAINQPGKSFMTQGARKLVIWRMDVLYEFRTKLSSPATMIKSTWHPDVPQRIAIFSADNSFRIINPNTGMIISSVVLPANAPPATYFEYHRTPIANKMYIIWNGDNSGIDIHTYDCDSNPAKLVNTWKEQEYDSIITAFAVFNRTTKIELFEKQLLVFLNRKNEKNIAGEIFLIVGRIDGNVGIIDLDSGNLLYEQKCHKSSVRDIVIDHEMKQFISLSIEPSARLWKIMPNQEEVFVPLMDIVWRYPIRFIAMVRDVVAFVMTHPDIKQHKIVMYSLTKSARMDHRAHYSHMKEIISFSSQRELELFCSASTDETVRIWNAKNEMIRCIFLNWIPTIATFGSKQGDIFVGIDNNIHVLTANKYLTIIYRNRVLKYGYNAGEKESVVPFFVQKVGRDQRLILVSEEPKEMPPLPNVEFYNEPRESQRAKDIESLRIREEDIKSIIEGRHPIENNVPDPRNMTKKEWDDFGKSVFDDDDAERKFFVSESRLACMLKMKGERKGFETYDNIF